MSMKGSEFEGLENARHGIKVFESAEDVYFDVALDIFDLIRVNNAQGRKSVLILPVGPVKQYENLVDLINRYRLIMKNVFVFNMDEYLTDDRQYISMDNPLSFRRFMKHGFYDKIDRELTVPEENRFFPEPGNEGKVWKKITELGGVDVCLGGMGFNGHIAFNEPPEGGSGISDEEFRNLPTRILRVSRETRTINSVSSTQGDFDAIPPWCITIGMKEILSSRKILMLMTRPWQYAIIRKALCGPVTAKVPCSFLQEHPDVSFTVASCVVRKNQTGLV